MTYLCCFGNQVVMTKTLTGYDVLVYVRTARLQRRWGPAHGVKK